MKANILGMIEPLEATIRDHEEIIRQHEAQRDEATDESTKADHNAIIVEQQNQIKQAQDEFLRNENFLKVDDVVSLQAPDKEASEATVVSREFYQNPETGHLDIFYSFDNGEMYSQSLLDQEGYSSEKAA